MSYCRWSSDNFNCDLYCFEHVGGWYQTYVASSRHRTWLRVFNWLTDRRIRYKDGAFRVERFQTWKWPHWLTHKRIRHPLAGASFEDATEKEMFVGIIGLHKQGFKVPKNLLEEAYENTTNRVTERPSSQ